MWCHFWKICELLVETWSSLWLLFTGLFCVCSGGKSYMLHIFLVLRILISVFNFFFGFFAHPSQFGEGTVMVRFYDWLLFFLPLGCSLAYLHQAAEWASGRPGLFVVWRWSFQFIWACRVWVAFKKFGPTFWDCLFPGIHWLSYLTSCLGPLPFRGLRIGWWDDLFLFLLASPQKSIIDELVQLLIDVSLGFVVYLGIWFISL